jgi:hypothetical protein
MIGLTLAQTMSRLHFDSLTMSDIYRGAKAGKQRATLYTKIIGIWHSPRRYHPALTTTNSTGCQDAFPERILAGATHNHIEGQRLAAVGGAAAPAVFRMTGNPSFPEPTIITFEFGDSANFSVASMPFHSMT